MKKMMNSGSSGVSRWLSRQALRRLGIIGAALLAALAAYMKQQGYELPGGRTVVRPSSRAAS